jgi:hypothetical protein
VTDLAALTLGTQGDQDVAVGKWLRVRVPSLPALAKSYGANTPGTGEHRVVGGR